MVMVATHTRQSLPAPGGEVELHIHTHVREDQLSLYGFASVEELELFEQLIQVDGVGPKVGLNILSAASLEVLKRAIMSEDAAPIRRASGVGPRTAAKVIIELKPRLDAVAALEVVPRAAADIKRRLFEIVETDPKRSRTASNLLAQIEEFKPDLVLNQDLFHVDTRLARRIKQIGRPILWR